MAQGPRSIGQVGELKDQGLFVFPRGPLNQPSFPRKRESRTLGESVKSAGCTENEKALIKRPRVISRTRFL